MIRTMIQLTMNRRKFQSHTAIAAAATALPGFAYAANAPLAAHRIEEESMHYRSQPVGTALHRYSASLRFFRADSSLSRSDSFIH